ncbi:MAG: ATP-binding cassette domain-containing protein [Deltaproteobacteria bacterium]|jgi:peptide/nickel transport system ATP-binding protein
MDLHFLNVIQSHIYRLHDMLNIQNLTICFRTPKGVTRAVDGISLRIASGEVVGIVGESGCGKSVLALSIMGLLPKPPAFVSGGEILFKGRDLLKLSSNDLRLLRGNQISMIFQEPMTALNPVFTVGNQLWKSFAFMGITAGQRPWNTL